MIWVVFAVLTGLAVLSILWPLGRARGGAPRVAVDRGIYEAEIAGIDRDVDRGLASPEDAAAAKAEAARRLIAVRAADKTQAPTSGAAFNRRAAAVIALAFIPGFAFGLYWLVGAAGAPDMPLAARLAAPPAQTDVYAALARIEQHLSDEPDDARGWAIVAPVYMQLGRPGDAARAWQKVIQLRGVTAESASSFGEALVYAADGQVTPQARAAFEAALQDDEKDPRAQFFLGLAAEQAGEPARAIALWTRLLQGSPSDAPYAQAVRDRIAALKAATPSTPEAGGPDSPAGAAIVSMAPEDREKIIRGMVDGLAEKLSRNGADIDGWLRLVRAYTVLKDNDKALAALADARKALGADAAAMGRLDALSRELGLGG